MPPRPGMELGAPPPPRPRELPRGFVRRTRWFNNTAIIAGTVFSVFGGGMLAAMLALKSFAAIIPACFLIGGISMLRYGWVHASSILRAFREGIAVPGEIKSVLLDTTQSINRRHPWKLVYHFIVDGHTQEGSVVSFDSTLQERRAGQPLWVLYVAEDPDQNTPYPPLK